LTSGSSPSGLSNSSNGLSNSSRVQRRSHGRCRRRRLFSRRVLLNSHALSSNHVRSSDPLSPHVLYNSNSSRGPRLAPWSNHARQRLNLVHQRPRRSVARIVAAVGLGIAQILATDKSQ
jgi:hypothetical protein